MQQPEKGFYYHYRHDSNGPVNNCDYEVLGNAFNTESVDFKTENPDDFLKDEVVIYRPLYDTSLVFKADKRFWVRPAKMFLENITKDGEAFSRFIKITDEKVITELIKIRDEMYG